jgi:hypothetical protein
LSATVSFFFFYVLHSFSLNARLRFNLFRNFRAIDKDDAAIYGISLARLTVLITKQTSRKQKKL